MKKKLVLILLLEAMLAVPVLSYAEEGIIAIEEWSESAVGTDDSSFEQSGMDEILLEDADLPQNEAGEAGDFADSDLLIIVDDAFTLEETGQESQEDPEYAQTESDSGLSAQEGVQTLDDTDTSAEDLPELSEDDISASLTIDLGELSAKKEIASVRFSREGLFLYPFWDFADCQLAITYEDGETELVGLGESGMYSGEIEYHLYSVKKNGKKGEEVKDYDPFTLSGKYYISAFSKDNTNQKATAEIYFYPLYSEEEAQKDLTALQPQIEELPVLTAGENVLKKTKEDYFLAALKTEQTGQIAFTWDDEVSDEELHLFTICQNTHTGDWEIQYLQPELSDPQHQLYEVEADQVYYMGRQLQTDEEIIKVTVQGQLTNPYEKEKETECSADSENEVTAEILTESETEADSEFLTDSDAESSTEILTDSQVETNTESLTAPETESGLEIITDTEAESSADILAEFEMEANTERSTDSGDVAEMDISIAGETDKELSGNLKTETEMEIADDLEVESGEFAEIASMLQLNAAETEIEALFNTETETEAETETETETKTEAETETETETETEIETGTESDILPESALSEEMTSEAEMKLNSLTICPVEEASQIPSSFLASAEGMNFLDIVLEYEDGTQEHCNQFTSESDNGVQIRTTYTDTAQEDGSVLRTYQVEAYSDQEVQQTSLDIIFYPETDPLDTIEESQLAALQLTTIKNWKLFSFTAGESAPYSILSLENSPVQLLIETDHQITEFTSQEKFHLEEGKSYKILILYPLS